MPDRYRNDTGGVLISLDFGVIGPGELVADHYDPEVHGVIPGCARVEDPESGPPATEPADVTPPETARKRSGSKAAGTETEAGA